MFLPTSEFRVEADRIKPREQILEGSVDQVHRDTQTAINDKVEKLEDLWNVWIQNIDLREDVGAIRASPPVGCNGHANDGWAGAKSGARSWVPATPPPKTLRANPNLGSRLPQTLISALSQSVCPASCCLP